MTFSWKGFVLAPLLVPLLCSAVIVGSSESRNPILGFLVVFAIGSLISYCGTIFFFLPSLLLVSKFTSLSFGITSTMGAVLGAFAYIAYERLAFQASGFNSGPPQGTFVEYLWRQLFDPIAWVLFLVAGFATAALYWILCNQRGDGRRPV